MGIRSPWKSGGKRERRDAKRLPASPSTNDAHTCHSVPDQKPGFGLALNANSYLYRNGLLPCILTASAYDIISAPL